MEVLRRCPLAIAQRLVHCAIALSTAVLDRVTKTMSVAPLLTNNLDNSKQKTSNLLSPAPPPYSWSLLGKSEGPAPPPSSKISWSFDLAWNPGTLPAQHTTFNTLDNWAINPPPNQKGKGPERKGYRVMARNMYTIHSVTYKVSLSWIYHTGDSSVVRAPDSWLKGRGFESLLERRENFLLQGRLSVLTLISVSVPPPCYHSST